MKLLTLLLLLVLSLGFSAPVMADDDTCLTGHDGGRTVGKGDLPEGEVETEGNGDGETSEE
jgi:hypothetical protein